VRQPAEHDVVHGRELAGDRRVQHGVAVAVDRGPPRRHRVEHLDLTPVVDERQPGTLGADRNDRRQRFGPDRAVGMPDMCGVDRTDLGGGQHEPDPLLTGCDASPAA